MQKGMKKSLRFWIVMRVWGNMGKGSHRVKHPIKKDSVGIPSPAAGGVKGGEKLGGGGGES